MNENLNPQVSVIMTVYNVQDFVEESILSILNQSYTNFELLICDDCSTDNSLERITTYQDKRIRIFTNKVNKGYLQTCNDLFKCCKGELITFQDSDDYSHKDRLKLLVHEFRSNPELRLCGSNFFRVGYKLNDSTNLKSFLPTDDKSIRVAIDDKTSRFPILGGSVMIRRDVLDTIGVYRSFFDRIGHEHVDWILRIIEKYEVSNLKEHLYYYRYVPNSFSRLGKTKSAKKYYASDLTYFLKNQRNKYGQDGLENQEYLAEFLDYNLILERKFKDDKINVYCEIILNRLYNDDFESALKLYFESIQLGHISINLLWLFISGAFKLFIKRFLKILIHGF